MDLATVNLETVDCKCKVFSRLREKGSRERIRKAFNRIATLLGVMLNHDIQHVTAVPDGQWRRYRATLTLTNQKLCHLGLLQCPC